MNERNRPESTPPEQPADNKPKGRPVREKAADPSPPPADSAPLHDEPPDSLGGPR